MDVTLLIVVLCVALAVVLIVVFLVFGRGEANFTFDIGGAAPRASGGSDSSTEKTASSRLVGLAVAVGAAFTVLVGRLWSMQLVSSEEYAEQAESNRRSTIYTQAPRGRILDRNGIELVTNRSSLTLVAEGGVVELTVIAQDTSAYGSDLYGKPMLRVAKSVLDGVKKSLDVPELPGIGLEPRDEVGEIARSERLHVPDVVTSVDIETDEQKSVLDAPGTAVGSLPAIHVGKGQITVADARRTGVFFDGGLVFEPHGMKFHKKVIRQS